MISQDNYILSNQTTCFGSLNPSSGTYRLKNLQANTGKGKGHPRIGHKDPEGEQRYRTTLSLTSALDGVGG
jgi:hypothetical protein